MKTVMNLFKARIRPTNLYATTEEENVRFAVDSYKYSDALASIMGVQIKKIILMWLWYNRYDMITESVILYKKALLSKQPNVID